MSEKAFGSQPDSVGIVIVRDLPDEYVGYREQLLQLAYKFSSLQEDVRERYSDPKSSYRSVLISDVLLSQLHRTFIASAGRMAR